MAALRPLVQPCADCRAVTTVRVESTQGPGKVCVLCAGCLVARVEEIVQSRLGR
jgi:hypothetical protein